MLMQNDLKTLELRHHKIHCVLYSYIAKYSVVPTLGQGYTCERLAVVLLLQVQNVHTWR